MNTKFFMTIAIAATLLTACNKDNEPDENYNGEIRLRSGIEVETRAFTPTQSTTIDYGEIVSVWVDDAKTPDAGVTTEHLYKANPVTANGSNGLTPIEANKMYFPQTGNKVNIYAIHGTFVPSFNKGDDFPSVSGAEYSVNNSQTKPTYYTQSDLLYAYSLDVERTKTTVPLTFYHMLSKLEVAIAKGVGAPELDYSNAVTLGNVTLNGKFTPGTPTDMSVQTNRAAMLAAATSPSTGDMTLGQVISTDFTAANLTYNEAIVVPQSMKGKTLIFKLKDGGALTYTFPDITFESGKKYQYKITLDLTGLTVTSEIVDWSPVSAVEGTASMQ